MQAPSPRPLQPLGLTWEQRSEAVSPQRAGTRSFEVLRSLISICLRTESCSVLVLQPGFLTSCAQETLLTP